MVVVDLVEAAEHRLVAARGATSRVWRLRHMHAALGHMVEAMGLMLEEAEGEAEVAERVAAPAWESRQSRREPIRAGQL